MFYNLGSTTNFEIFHFFSSPSLRGVGVKQLWLIFFSSKFLFLIFRKGKEVSKLYVYTFKSVRNIWKRCVKLTPPPAMDRVKSFSCKTQLWWGYVQKHIIYKCVSGFCLCCYINRFFGHLHESLRKNMNIFFESFIFAKNWFGSE